jgi:hypothetical protein
MTDADDRPEIQAAIALLPAWFVPRMMDDEWFFGLTLVTGKTLAISKIQAVHQDAEGSLWLDVTMLRDFVGYLNAPTSRLTASIRASSVVMAFELADT